MKKIVTVQQREINLASGREVITHQCAWCGCTMGVTIDGVRMGSISISDELISSVSHGACDICTDQIINDFKNGVRKSKNTTTVNPLMEASRCSV